MLIPHTAGTTAATTYSAGTSSGLDILYTPFDQVKYIHVETRREYLLRRSNECANMALDWGVHGKTITAEYLAEMAELYAILEAQQAALDGL